VITGNLKKIGPGSPVSPIARQRLRVGRRKRNLRESFVEGSAPGGVVEKLRMRPACFLDRFAGVSVPRFAQGRKRDLKTWQIGQRRTLGFTGQGPGHNRCTRWPQFKGFGMQVDAARREGGNSKCWHGLARRQRRPRLRKSNTSPNYHAASVSFKIGQHYGGSPRRNSFVARAGSAVGFDKAMRLVRSSPSRDEPFPSCSGMEASVMGWPSIVDRPTITISVCASIRTAAMTRSGHSYAAECKDEANR